MDRFTLKDPSKVQQTLAYIVSHLPNSMTTVLRSVLFTLLTSPTPKSRDESAVSMDQPLSSSSPVHAPCSLHRGLDPHLHTGPTFVT